MATDAPPAAATEATPVQAPAPVQVQANPNNAAPAPSASLYVGDLNSDVTEAMLFEKFNGVGPVASIRVCRDAITRRSLGYAYVNFVNPADAEKAIENMNYDPIQGRPCRIMWSQRDPALRRAGKGNIFIKNLDPEIDNKALYDTFSAFGTILSCKVVTSPEGESRGYGFVHYETAKAAEAAIEKVDGMLLNDRKVYVGPFKSKADRMDDIERAAAQYKNLYIKNFPVDWTEEKIEEVFGKFGTITSRVIQTRAMREGEEEKPRPHAFVAFETSESARAAVEALNETEYGEDKIYVGRAEKKAERLNKLRIKYEKQKAENAARYKGVNLYIKNLDETIDDAKLREAFSEFGTITSVKVMCDDKGVSKGFGFVCFSSADEATKAVTEMNGKMLDSDSDKRKPLYVALAQRKDDRKQQLALMHNQRMHAMRMQSTMYQQPGMQPGGMVYMPTMQPQMMAGYAGQQRGYPQARPRFVQGAGGPAMQQQQMMMQQQMAMQQRGMAPARAVGPKGGRGGRGAGGGRGGGGRGGPRPPMQMQQMAMMQAQQQQAQQQQQQAIHQQGQEPLTASALASATNEQQKQMLGERLFPLIQQTNEEQAGKITGMLLEMDNSELLHLLEAPEALRSKVAEAVDVLERHAASASA